MRRATRSGARHAPQRVELEGKRIERSQEDVCSSRRGVYNRLSASPRQRGWCSGGGVRRASRAARTAGPATVELEGELVTVR